MLVIYRIQLFTFIACLLAASTAIAGDLAAGPPVSLASKLRAITAFKLDDLDAQARESIELARRQLNAALQAQPVQADKLAAAYGELGGLYQGHFLYPAAEDCYHNAMQLAGDDFRWAYYAAYLADIEGRTRLALDRYRHARTLRPGYKALTVRLGNALLDLNELDNAQAAFEQVVNATGLEAASLYGLGQVALLKRDYASAIEAFTRALEIEPGATRIHYPLAQALRATQRNADAKTQLALRGDLSPSIKDPQIESLEALKIGSRIHFIQAMKAIRRQDYATASASFAEGLVSEPDNVLARISYARTLYLIDKKTAAQETLEAALARQADNALGLYLLGVLAEEQGDADMAAAYYQRAIRDTPDHHGAHHQLASQFYRQGNYVKAAQHYAASLRGEPDNLAVTNAYVGTLLRGEAPAKTLMTGLANALQRFPEYAGFRSLQILLLAGSRDPEIHDPQTALKNAQQLNDQHRIPPHQELLGLAYAAAGDYQEAVSIQEDLLSYARRSMPGEADRVAKTLAYYQAGTRPPLDELINYAALQPPPFNASMEFRDYPAARPY